MRNQIALGDDYHASIALAANGQGNQHAERQRLESGNGQPLPKERSPTLRRRLQPWFNWVKTRRRHALQAGYYHHRYEASGFMGLGPRARGLPDEGGNLTDLNMGRLSLSHQFDSNAHWSLGILLGNGQQDGFQSGHCWMNFAGPSIYQRYDQHRFGAQAIYRDQLDDALGHPLDMGTTRTTRESMTTASVRASSGAFTATGARRAGRH